LITKQAFLFSIIKDDSTADKALEYILWKEAGNGNILEF
jgi:hypothetical protein